MRPFDLFWNWSVTLDWHVLFEKCRGDLPDVIRRTIVADDCLETWITWLAIRKLGLCQSLVIIGQQVQVVGSIILQNSKLFNQSVLAGNNYFALTLSAYERLIEFWSWGCRSCCRGLEQSGRYLVLKKSTHSLLINDRRVFVNHHCKLFFANEYKFEYRYFVKRKKLLYYFQI